jgi:hypothetical protein
MAWYGIGTAWHGIENHGMARHGTALKTTARHAVPWFSIPCHAMVVHAMPCRAVLAMPWFSQIERGQDAGWVTKIAGACG